MTVTNDQTACSIVRDLLPLYVEDLVSAQTAAFVRDHLAECPACRAELEALKEGGEVPLPPRDSAPPVNDAKPFKKMMRRWNRQFYSVGYAALIFLIFLGFGWTEGENLMYNSLIMPTVGVFGYCVFRWKAVYKVPLLLLVIDTFVCLCKLVELDLYSAFLWTVIYSLFVFVGIAIAFLLHFALGKEKDQ